MTRFFHRHAPLLLANAFCLAALLPFLNKPFHIDDPMYLWAAQHIRQHPLNFYGFEVNWYGVSSPMAQVMKNPPLTSYYLALASLVLGWSEVAMHAALLLPAMGLVTATFLLAQRLGARPLLAAAATIFTPATLIAAATVMSDVLMLCLFVWAIYLWMRGIDDRRRGDLMLAALCATAAALTKYFAVAAIALMLVYALLQARRPGWWIVQLLVPVVLLALYQVWTQRLYGQGLLFSAAEYAASDRWREAQSIGSRIVGSLSFVGGCGITLALILWLTWPRRAVIASAIGIVVLFLVVSRLAPGMNLPLGSRAQLAASVAAGVVLLAGCTFIAWRARGAANLTLLIWIAGTLVFAGVANWTVSGRTILPLVPPAAVLVARGMSMSNLRRPLLAIALGAGIALVAAWGDATIARADRAAALDFARRSKDYSGNRWFMGHWGFQWYMEQQGIRAIDAARNVIEPGDLIFVPIINTNLIELPEPAVRRIDELSLPGFTWATTADRRLGAGFYSNLIGPLPLVIGCAEARRYEVYQAMGRIVLRNPRIGALQSRFKPVRHRAYVSTAARRSTR